MTTREFINTTFGIPSQKGRRCSSIVADCSGNIYSYGPHYPLLFSIDGLTFRNRTGYSTTTSRHVSMAEGIPAIDIWLSGCDMYSYDYGDNRKKVPYLLSLQQTMGRFKPHSPFLLRIKKAVLNDLYAELADIGKRLNSKKRRDTQTYALLEDEYSDCHQRIARVERAWGMSYVNRDL